MLLHILGFIEIFGVHRVHRFYCRLYRVLGVFRVRRFYRVQGSGNTIGPATSRSHGKPSRADRRLDARPAVRV